MVRWRQRLTIWTQSGPATTEGPPGVFALRATLVWQSDTTKVFANRSTWIIAFWIASHGDASLAMMRVLWPGLKQRVSDDL
jgi:hypothetical protein